LSLIRRFLNKFLDLPSIYKTAKRIEKSQQITILYYRDFFQQDIFKLIQRIKVENDLVMKDVEAIQLYKCVASTRKIKGDIAEIGTYNGASAKIICEAGKGKNIYLFDTFKGIPHIGKYDKAFHKGQFKGSYEFVQNYLKNYPNISIYKGLFPNTAKPIEDNKFSFVNLDVDTYQSTLDCLNFFYIRMSKGGIILSHDYVNAEGVRNAFNQFFNDKPEIIIQLTGTHVMVVKL